MGNNGRDYERFVALLQQALLDAECIAGQKNIRVELNKKIIDACGTEREFDLYWEYELAGITYKTVIECKDYDSRIPIEKIDALVGKIHDIPDVKAVFATRKGYQSGAKAKAEANKIDLLIVREQNDSDWKDVDGTPFLKTLHLHSTCIIPPRITKFEPLVDGAWAKENTSLGLSEESSISGLNNEIFIEDEGSNERYSLLELENKLASPNNNEYGSFSKKERFDSAWIVGPGFKYKLKGYNLEYVLSKPYRDQHVIDLSKELIGVIEYLQKGKKKTIFREGIIREDPLAN